MNETKCHLLFIMMKKKQYEINVIRKGKQGSIFEIRNQKLISISLLLHPFCLIITNQYRG